jgi:LysM repeat protein
MNISLFYKSYIVKACSFFVIFSFIAGTPFSADASFFSDLTTTVFGGEAQANETIVPSESNLQNMDILATNSSIPDLKNADMSEEPIRMGWDGSYIESDGSLDSGNPIIIEKSPLSDQISIYTVKEGDTLSELADLFDVSVNTIRWENNISGQTISVGQKLNILPVTGVKHIVKSGDTISKIADKYEADSEDILIFNDISKEDSLKIGDLVFVPNGIIKTVVPKTSSSNSNYIAPSNTKAPLGYYMRPVAGRITSPYGSRRRGFHPGVDIGNARGTTIVAAASGVVTEVVNGCVEGRKKCGGGYGNHIEIVHPNGTTTRYAHLSRTFVNTGQEISQGQNIGALGSTGNSTGPHLHFEIMNANGSKMRPPV